ncbi:hypothetical protein MSAN_01181700 [Mycena sanguinolenta]|uniref:DUF6534 domain-containing protein n=1 Tax=Mycena sanguinolenta TaxID=230812 RepID=A0A8H6YM09_9AGAR|nr:hypothetical protein MSAN_01181700 [Mycena sanguinolenta]
MAEELDSLPLTIGALIGGCMVAVGLSAIVGFQTFLYFQIFPLDTLPYKCLVAWIWLTDTGHTFTICSMIWEYGVKNFNNPAKLLEIVPAYPVHIILTITATLNANLFYTWRIHKMSKYNWRLTGPLCVLCLARTSLGLFIAIEMLITKPSTWHNIGTRFKAGEVAAWSVSATTDVVISLARYYYLRDLKQGYMPTRELVDAVVIFTINDGLLTCATVITVIACFLSMDKNFVWIAVFLTLAKLFSNSILATLNLRNWFRQQRPMGIPLTRQHATRNTLQLGHSPEKSVQSSNINMHDNIHHIPATMEVFVDQQVEYVVGKYDEANEHVESNSVN